MAEKPTGIIALTLTGWLDHLARAARRVHKGLSESHLMDRMSEFTLLGPRKRGCEEPLESIGGGLR